MKKYILILIIFTLSSITVSAETEKVVLVSEVVTSTGTQLIIPDEINWTQRFILGELRDLRIDLEQHQREINNTINEKELTTVDRALSYSANTVNFFFVILTIAVMGMGLFGWRTMKDIKENLSRNFEKEVQKKVTIQQKKLEEFMNVFQEEQLEQGKAIIQNQEFIQQKQEAAYYWSQYNREENAGQRLELLEKIGILALEEDIILIHVERSGIYIELGLWDKSLEASEKGLEISSENSTLLYNKAQALTMLEQKEEALKVINNILAINPAMKEDILEAPVFDSLLQDIESMIEDMIV